MANRKWQMCIDFMDLNNVCIKDSHALPYIDTLVDNTSGYGVLNFMDPYSGYNQIRMHPIDRDKMTFMVETTNYCYSNDI